MQNQGSDPELDRRLSSGRTSDEVAPDEPTTSAASAANDGERSLGPKDMFHEDMMDAQAGRPDLPGEISDGLDDMEEEIRHQAEDLSLDTSGRT